MGLLDNPDLLMNLGMGLMAGSKFGSNAGEGLMQGMQNYQSQRAANQDYQIKQYQLQRQQAMQQMLQGLMSPTQGDASQPTGPNPTAPQTAPAPSGNASGLPSTAAPQGAQLPASFTPPNVSGMSIGGMSPKLLQAYGMASGKDPITSAKEVHDQQLALAQQQVAPALAKLDTVIKSDKPTQYAQADPELTQAWQALAPHAGFDPAKDFNDQNLRTVLTMGRNQLSAAVSKESLAPINQPQQISGPLGARYSKDALTGEIKQEIAPQETANFIGPDGKPVMMTKAEGMAKGLQPFSPSVFGASNISSDAKELAYQQWTQNGGVMPSGMSKNPMMTSQLLDYFAKRSAADGNTALSLIAKGQQNKAAAAVVKDFTSGKTSQSLNGLNTAVAHMDALDPLIDNLNNTASPAFNKVANFFKSQTGSPAPTNYAAIKEFVGGEVAKAVLPGGGGEAERKALTDPLNAANSPAMLKQAVQQIKTALAGKTEALRNQWDVGTNGTQGAFDKFLLPPTKKALGLSDQPPAAANAPSPTNPQGWILHKDAQGRMAYVSPDGKNFKLVQ